MEVIMAFKKYAESEGDLEVLRGKEAVVLNEHFSKTGKRAVSDFSAAERKALNKDLDSAREEEETPAEEDK
jgi:hypothetical protein